MKVDAGDRLFDKGSFEYIEDPEIDSVESGVTAGQVSFMMLLNYLLYWYCN